MLSAKQKKTLLTWGISVDKDGIKVDSKKLFGIDEKTLLEAESSKEESDIELSPKPDGFTIFDDAGLNDFKSKVKTDAKPEMEKALKEILAKVWKEKHGVKLDTKDPDEVLEAIILAKSTAAVDAAKLTVDEQVKLKDTDLNKLRDNFTAVEKERDDFKSKAEKAASDLNEYKDTTDFGGLIAGKFTPLLKPSEIRQRLMEEEGIVIKRDNGVWKPFDASTGKVLQNKKLEDISVSDALKGVLDKRKEWAAPAAGADGGNGGSGSGKGHGTGSSGADGGAGGNGESGTAGIKTFSQFKEFANKRTDWGNKGGPKWNARYQNEYNKLVADKEFDPNS